MRKILNISATIQQLSVGESMTVSFRDMTDGSVRASAYRLRDKKFKVSVDRDKMRTTVTRVS